MNKFGVLVISRAPIAEQLTQQLQAHKISVTQLDLDSFNDPISFYRQSHTSAVILHLTEQTQEGGYPLDQVNQYLQEIQQIRKDAFLCVLCESGKITASLRTILVYNNAAHVVSDKLSDFVVPLDLAINTSLRKDKKDVIYECPICTKRFLSEDDLWVHTPLYHGKHPNQKWPCPICRSVPKRPYAVHMRNSHGPVGRGEIQEEQQSKSVLHSYSLVVCQRESDSKYLLVQENASSGWWLPGGAVDYLEDPLQAAHREALEEASIHLDIKGILRVEFSQYHNYSRQRVIYFARPAAGEEEKVKVLPDFESVGSAWVSFEELRRLPLRGPEPLLWAEYLDRGGAVYPLSLMSSERSLPYTHSNK